MRAILINSLTSGGAEKVVLTLLNRFKKTGESMHLICLEHQQYYDIPEGVKVSYLTRFQLFTESYYKFILLFISAFRLRKYVVDNNISLVQSHLLSSSFVNIMSKIFGSKHHVQIIIHSRINFDHLAFPLSYIKKKLYRWFFLKADAIISISEVMKKELDDYLQLQEHSQHLVINNPHELKEIASMAKEEVKDFEFSDQKQYIISAGRLAKGKRLEVLFKALKRLRKNNNNIELLIVGDGPEEKIYKEFVKALGIQQCVHFLSYQTNPYAYIARSDVFVLCSEWEGLPNIIIESLICGTAVISSDCISGPREILNPESDLSVIVKDKIERGAFGLLYPVGSVDLLTKALQQLLENEELRDHYVKKGLERATDFDADRITKSYLKTFPKELRA
ncbi:MAG TPA: glycosyltransferase [Saprospiraceae bacterium]|nr:glycosyltransferase [Saprospiraceae bacterium]